MAKQLKLTDKAVAALPTPEKGQREEYADTELVSLRLRVSPSGIKTFSLLRRVSLLIVAATLSACVDKGEPDDQVFTLYSTNFPNDSGRSPVATFDVAAIPELTQSICQEAAELYQADFEKRKRENAGNATWTNAKSRYWCEKGRYRK